MAIKENITTDFFVAVVGSGIRDPESRWVKIRIRDKTSRIRNTDQYKDD
jgi:hypothetical protein